MRPTDKPLTDFWRLLAKWNKAQRIKLNQGQLAVLFGVSDQAISDWKYGTSWPSRTTLGRVADETKISYGVLAKTIEADKKRLAGAPTRAKKPGVVGGGKENRESATDS